MHKPNVSRCAVLDAGSAPGSSGAQRARVEAPGSADAHEPHFTTGHLLKDLRGHTISSGFVTMVAQGGLFILNLASTMVLARLLVPQDFGLVAMVTTVMGFFRIFKDAGLSTATVQREGITHAQVSNLFWINLALSGFISLSVAACAPVIAWFYREPRLIGITGAMAISFLLAGSTVQHLALLTRQMRFKSIAIIQLASMAAGVAVAIAMAWLKCGYWSLVWSNLATAVLSCVLTWSASGWRPQRPTRRCGTRPLLSFGANLATAGFIWSLARGSDGLLIGRFCGPGAVGLYSRAAALLMRPLEQFITPIESVFVPTLSRLQTQPERYRRTFLQVYQGIALTAFLFTGMFLALARPLTLVVLGPKWDKAAMIFAAFTICALFHPLSYAATWLFASQGRGRDWLVSSLIVSGLTVASFIVGLPFGPAGVAISYSVSGVLIQMPVLFYIAGRRGPVAASDLWAGFWRFVPLWCIVGGATWLARGLVRESASLAQVVICAPVGLLAGAVFIWIYSPARQVAVTILDALRDWRKTRNRL